jgi:hypothetical protein
MKEADQIIIAMLDEVVVLLRQLAGTPRETAGRVHRLEPFDPAQLEPYEVTEMAKPKPRTQPKPEQPRGPGRPPLPKDPNPTGQ